MARDLAPDGGPKVHPNWKPSGVKHYKTKWVEFDHPITGKPTLCRLRDEHVDPTIHREPSEELLRERQPKRRKRRRARLVDDGLPVDYTEVDLAALSLDDLRELPEFFQIPGREKLTKKGEVISAILKVREITTR